MRKRNSQKQVSGTVQPISVPQEFKHTAFGWERCKTKNPPHQATSDLQQLDVAGPASPLPKPDSKPAFWSIKIGRPPSSTPKTKLKHIALAVSLCIDAHTLEGHICQPPNDQTFGGPELGKKC